MDLHYVILILKMETNFQLKKMNVNLLLSIFHFFNNCI